MLPPALIPDGHIIRDAEGNEKGIIHDVLLARLIAEVYNDHQARLAEMKRQGGDLGR